jgi:prevent-host-death family protein
MIAYNRGRCPDTAQFLWFGADMTEEGSLTQSIDVAAAAAQLLSLAERVAEKETRVLIEEAGTPIVALVSIKDLRRLERLDRQSAARLAAIAAISDAFADVPLEELEAQLARIAAEGPSLVEEKQERKLA